MPPPPREWLSVGEHVKREVAQELVGCRAEAAARLRLHAKVRMLNEKARGAPRPRTQWVVVARKRPVTMRLDGAEPFLRESELALVGRSHAGKSTHCVGDDLPATRAFPACRIRPVHRAEVGTGAEPLRIRRETRQLQRHRGGDLKGGQRRERPEAGPVIDRHRDADPVPGKEPPSGRHQWHRQLAVARQLSVDGTAGDELRAAVWSDVAQLDHRDHPVVPVTRREPGDRGTKQADRLGKLLTGEHGRPRLIGPLIEELAMLGWRRAPVASSYTNRDAGRCDHRSTKGNGPSLDTMRPAVARPPVSRDSLVRPGGRVVLTEEENAPSPMARGGSAAQVALKEVDQFAGERVGRPRNAPIGRNVSPWPGEELPWRAEVLRHPQAGSPVTVTPPRHDECRHLYALVLRPKRSVSPVGPVMLVLEPAQHPGWRFRDPPPPVPLGGGPCRG